jgi:16S rRNA (guanine(966)-N(2))-methyltransferase RsmD
LLLVVAALTSKICFMRITGGDWGGRSLQAPKGQNTRPTSDANREALFNILRHAFTHEMTYVLDFYAGSGALSFEALSRGASKALLFEKDPAAIRCIKKNCEALRIAAEDLRVLTHPKPEDWVRQVEDQAKVWGAFDTVFCDPPYSKGLVSRALSKVLASSALAEEALVYVELAREEETPEFAGWICMQRRDRGASAQCFFKRNRAVP